MSSDLESWIATVGNLYGAITPDMDWTEEVLGDTTCLEVSQFLSFEAFAEFPSSDIGLDLVGEGRMLNGCDEFQEKVVQILVNLGDVPFTDVASYAVLAIALESDTAMINYIPEDAPVVQTVWCLAQCIHCDKDADAVLRFWSERLFHPPPINDRVSCQAVLMILEFCAKYLEPRNVPPFTSDDYERVFALAYCSARSQVAPLARLIIPHLTPLIVASQAAHLLFRRMLPYCAMENKDGRRVAMQAIEEIVGNHLRFSSTVSTWITMHPFCVAASNNVLVDIQRRGLVTTRMKSLLKQLILMNRRLVKGKIRLTDDMRRSLPRSLWRVEFPPPREDVVACSETCRKILSSIERKASIMIPFVVLICTFYLLYWLV